MKKLNICAIYGTIYNWRVENNFMSAKTDTKILTNDAISVIIK